MSSAIKFSCKICVNNVTNYDQAIQYDLCDPWVQIKCNDLNYIDYKSLQNFNDFWFCISCCSKIFSFHAVQNKNFISHFYDSNNKSKNIDDKDSSLLLNHIIFDDPENTVSSKYYDIEDLQNLKDCWVKGVYICYQQ